MIVLLLSIGCSFEPGPDASLEDAGRKDAAPADAAMDAGVEPVDGGAQADAAVVELRAVAGPSRYAIVGGEVVLDGSASAGAVQYRWHFGNGTQADPSADPLARVRYAAPGRYRAVLTVFDADGNTDTDQATISVTDPIVHSPRSSGTIAIAGDRIAVVSPDSDELVIVARTGDAFALGDRFPTMDAPRTVTAYGDRFAVACQGADAVQIIGLDGATDTIPLPYGARPHAVTSTGASLWVTLQGPGAIAEIGASGLLRVIPAITDARGVAVLPGGKLAVSRWRSTDQRAEVAVVDLGAETSTVVTLAFDPQASSDTEIGGVPSYLDQVLVSPTGQEIVIPSLQVNVSDGAFKNGVIPRQETLLRAVLSFVELPDMVEAFERRKQFDDRGFAAAAAWSARGDYLYVAMRGNRAIERFDRLASTQSGTLLDVGYAPAGIAVTPDDRFIVVDASLSRELVIYSAEAFRDLRPPEARIPIVSSEPLDPEALRGKQLFNDSFDPRITRDGYIACAHCHLDGETDNRVWDFTHRGEGLRNTISLLGRGGDAHGPIHWSGNFDEIQDFEHDIRGAFGGTGLMEDAAFATGTRNQTLGDPKAGASEDLDALAAYAASLTEHPRSPHRVGAGDLSPAAERGRALFDGLGCKVCHADPRLTDSRFVAPAQPLLHDVGTLRSSSGGRLGGPLLGIDTPTLFGLWTSAPYLHDGSAATLEEVLIDRNPGDAHGPISARTPAQVADLVAYLLSL